MLRLGLSQELLSGNAGEQGGSLRSANLVTSLFPRKGDSTNTVLTEAILNESDLTGATITGAKAWGMTHTGCNAENVKAEYLNLDKDGMESGIVRFSKEQVEEFFRS